MSTNWNDFIDFYDWEFSHFNAEQSLDIEMWLTLCTKYPGNVIEFGAGSGRISKYLAQNGLKVTAVDNAQAFVDKMSIDNDDDNYEPKLGDMLTYNDNTQYSICIVSYTTFQYILNESDQLLALQNMSKLIGSEGVICLDLDPSVCDLPFIQREVKLYTKYHERFDCEVEMYTSHIVDNNSKIITWNDRYVVKNTEKKEFLHTLKLRSIDYYEIKTLLNSIGFVIIESYGDFSFTPYGDDSDRMIIIARKGKMNE